jgi:hypothetical protein
VERFEAPLEPGPGNRTVVPVPGGVWRALGGESRMRVRGTIGGVAFESSTIPTGGGRYVLVVPKEARAGLAAGDRVTVEAEPAGPRAEPELPPELERELAADEAARAAFERMAPSHRRDYATWIAEAKRPETRERRLQRTLELLRSGATTFRT